MQEAVVIFCGCTAWFVSDLVGNPEDRFSHNAAQKESTSTECIAKFLHAWHFLSWKFGHENINGNIFSILLMQEAVVIFCGCTAWFVSDLVGNPEDRFSHNAAQKESTSTECIAKFLHAWRFLSWTFGHENINGNIFSILLRLSSCHLLVKDVHYLLVSWHDLIIFPEI